MSGRSDQGSPIDQTHVDAIVRKRESAHKYTYGHALVLSGGFAATGAARLAARAALRIGAGLVTLGVPTDAQAEVAAQITAIMQSQIDSRDDLVACLRDERYNAICLGPGLGIDRARLLVPVVLADDHVARRSTVLDADALTAYRDRPDRLFAMLHPGCVLTPHEGEFARLFPDLTLGLADRRVEVAQQAASRAGCTVLVKGPVTVIADHTGSSRVHAATGRAAAPWLATAGTGDVLAGFITGLLARGASPLDAASAATWLHAATARRFGPGLIAEDLPDMLPTVLADLDP